MSLAQRNQLFYTGLILIRAGTASNTQQLVGNSRHCRNNDDRERSLSILQSISNNGSHTTNTLSTPHRCTTKFQDSDKLFLFHMKSPTFIKSVVKTLNYAFTG